MKEWLLNEQMNEWMNECVMLMKCLGMDLNPGHSYSNFFCYTTNLTNYSFSFLPNHLSITFITIYLSPLSTYYMLCCLFNCWTFAQLIKGILCTLPSTRYIYSLWVNPCVQPHYCFLLWACVCMLQWCCYTVNQILS